MTMGKNKVLRPAFADEIEMFRTHSREYGYSFVIARSGKDSQRS